MSLIVTFHISYVTYHVTNLISDNYDVKFHVTIEKTNFSFAVNLNWYFLAPCDRNYFNPGSSPTCTKCSLNTYQHVKGSASCVQCNSPINDKNCILAVIIQVFLKLGTCMHSKYYFKRGFMILFFCSMQILNIFRFTYGLVLPFLRYFW